MGFCLVLWGFCLVWVSWGFLRCRGKKCTSVLAAVFLSYKISFLKELCLMSAVLKFSFLVENLHKVMQYPSPGKILMAYVNEIRPAPGGIDRMLRRKLTVY